MNAVLEGAIFGAEAVGRNFSEGARDADEERVGFHPPLEPCFELRLAAEFIDEVAIVVEDGAIADDVGGAARGIEFRGDLRMQNPELALDGGGCVHRKRRLARDFGYELYVVVGFFEKGTEFVGESGFADAVSAD